MYYGLLDRSCADEGLHELNWHASHCCSDGISKCGAPDVCQDPSKFNPLAVASWVCGTDQGHEIEYCPPNCHQEDYETSDGDWRHSCWCNSVVSSKEECDEIFPGEMRKLLACSIAVADGSFDMAGAQSNHAHFCVDAGFAPHPCPSVELARLGEKCCSDGISKCGDPCECIGKIKTLKRAKGLGLRA